MGIIAWIVLGGVAGWLASLVTRTNDKMGCLTNILVGILGAFIGGFIFGYLGEGSVIAFNLWGLFVAFVGAVALLLILKLITSIGH